MISRFLIGLFGLLLIVMPGCRKYRDDLDYDHNVVQTWPLEELNYGEIVQFESVFWEPDDTVSLRKLIVDDAMVAGRDVLEIGTGTGIISILCLQEDANRVVATDINPAAVACATYNAAILVPDRELTVRKVPTDAPQAFSVVADTEMFDVIISNPPWEDGVITKPADHAYYDPGFVLMQSLLDGLPKHLKPGGRCLLAYGHVPAIKLLKSESEKRGYEFKILDDRDLDSLTKDFLPGMLVEVRLPLSARGKVNASDGVSANGSENPGQQENSGGSENESDEARVDRDSSDDADEESSSGTDETAESEAKK